MSRETITLEIKDLTQFARSLRAELPHKPSHVETLGLVARAAGYRNFQHLRARNAPKPVADEKLVARALEHFDDKGFFETLARQDAYSGLVPVGPVVAFAGTSGDERARDQSSR